MRAPTANIGLFLVALWLNSGCRQMLDIDQARLDPSLTSDDGSNANALAQSPGSDAGEELEEDVAAAEDGGNQDLLEQPSMDAGPPVFVPAPSRDDDAGIPPVTGEASLCLQYCLDVQKNCDGQYEQYQDLQICMGVCELMEPGEPGDTEGDTVECRLRQADLARLEPFTHCKFAGPIGHGACGSNCESYCDLMMLTCTEESSDGFFYADHEACMTDCAELDDLGEYTSAPDVGMFQGNHLQCRAFHVSAAIEEPEYHCSHAIGDFPCHEE